MLETPTDHLLHGARARARERPLVVSSCPALPLSLRACWVKGLMAEEMMEEVEVENEAPRLSESLGPRGIRGEWPCWAPAAALRRC